MPEPIVRVENLSKRYTLRHAAAGRNGYRRLSEELWDVATRPFRRNGAAAETSEEFWALKDVSFELQEGEVLGIIGRNGAGKSTLLKILSRITEPTEGRVTLRGRVASLLEVGTGFHPELTGRENIYLNGAILGMTRAEVRQKFDAIVAFAEVERFLDTPVKRYSSGMYVRLAFAVAAHLEPEILIVDEVLAVGDAEFQKRCLGKMGEVATSGRTVLFVSHNMAAVKSLTTRAILLAKGRLEVFASTDVAVASYAAMQAGPHSSAGSRRHHGRHSRIISVEMLDRTGRPASEYTSGETLHIRVLLEKQATAGLSIDLFLLDSLRQPIAMYSSAHYDQKYLPESLGTYQIDIRLAPIWLATGEYRWDVATAYPWISWDDYLDDVCQMSVVMCKAGSSSFNFSRTHNFGTLALPSAELLRVVKVRQAHAHPRSGFTGLSLREDESVLPVLAKRTLGVEDV